MHTSFQQLINYLEDHLNPEEVTKISLHLARCPECQRRLLLASQFLTNMRGRQQQRAATSNLSRPFAYPAAISKTAHSPSSTGERQAAG